MKIVLKMRKFVSRQILDIKSYGIQELFRKFFLLISLTRYLVIITLDIIAILPCLIIRLISPWLIIRIQKLPAETNNPKKELKDAVIRFLVNVSYLNLFVNSEQPKNYIMLVHTNVRKLVHNDDREVVDRVMGDLTTPEVIDKSLHPLVQNPVNSYILMGVVISKSVKIALIRANNGDEYFIRVGDLLGNADGTITEINEIGIKVTEENEVVELLVRNRGASHESAE